MGAMDEVRVDQWLWAVRVFKTRSASSAACKGGHVSVDGAPAKAATKVRAGSHVEAYAGDRRRMLEVVRPIAKRVGAATAAEALIDRTPPPPPREFAAPPLARDPGAGRPTKRDRRKLDQIRRG